MTEMSVELPYELELNGEDNIIFPGTVAALWQLQRDGFLLLELDDSPTSYQIRWALQKLYDSGLIGYTKSDRGAELAWDLDRANVFRI